MCVFALSFALSCGTANVQADADIGEDPPTYLQIFETVCVGTHFSMQGFSEVVSIFDSVEAFGPEQLSALGGAKIGYSFRDEDVLYFAVYGETRNRGFLSRSCGISHSSEDPGAVLETVQANYVVQLVDTQRQSGSTFHLFQADLFGQIGKTGISVKSGLGLTSITVIQVPISE